MVTSKKVILLEVSANVYYMIYILDFKMLK